MEDLNTNSKLFIKFDPIPDYDNEFTLVCIN